MAEIVTAFPRPAAPPEPASPVGLVTAEVVAPGTGADPSIVRIDGEERPAARAPSCVIQPMAGDRVLLAMAGPGREDLATIIAILGREETGPATLSVAGSAALRIASKDLSLEAEERLRLAAPRLDAEAGEARFRVTALHMVGDLLSGFVRSLEWASESIDSVARRIRSHAGQQTRIVEGVDHLKAGTALHRAENAYSLQGGQTVITARGDVRIDGERINLG